MNQQMIIGMYNYLALANTITRKLLDMWPEDGLDFRPTPEIRSAREIFEHIYGGTVAHARAARDKRMTEEDIRASAAPAACGKAELAAFCDACFTETMEIVHALNDEDMRQTVDMFYGKFPAWQVLSFNIDEHWHHRGQLTVYARLLGFTPPFLYGYSN